MKSAETPQKTEPPPQETFKPFDYTQTDLKVFAGMHMRFIRHRITQITTYFYIQLQFYIIKIQLNQCTPFVFTGTKPKDNTQFDPNRQAHDFKKKVFIYLIVFVEQYIFDNCLSN